MIELTGSLFFFQLSNYVELKIFKSIFEVIQRIATFDVSQTISY